MEKMKMRKFCRAKLRSGKCCCWLRKMPFNILALTLTADTGWRIQNYLSYEVRFKYQTMSPSHISSYNGASV